MSKKGSYFKTIRKGKLCYIKVTFDNPMLNYVSVKDQRTGLHWNMATNKLENLNSIEKLLYA